MDEKIKRLRQAYEEEEQYRHVMFSPLLVANVLTGRIRENKKLIRADRQLRNEAIRFASVMTELAKRYKFESIQIGQYLYHKNDILSPIKEIVETNMTVLTSLPSISYTKDEARQVKTNDIVLQFIEKQYSLLSIVTEIDRLYLEVQHGFSRLQNQRDNYHILSSDMENTSRALQNKTDEMKQFVDQLKKGYNQYPKSTEEFELVIEQISDRLRYIHVETRHPFSCYIDPEETIGHVKQFITTYYMKHIALSALLFTDTLNRSDLPNHIRVQDTSLQSGSVLRQLYKVSLLISDSIHTYLCTYNDTISQIKTFVHRDVSLRHIIIHNITLANGTVLADDIRIDTLLQEHTTITLHTILEHTLVLYMSAHGCDDETILLRHELESRTENDFYNVISPLMMYESPGHTCGNFSQDEETSHKISQLHSIYQQSRRNHMDQVIAFIKKQYRIYNEKYKHVTAEKIKEPHYKKLYQKYQLYQQKQLSRDAWIFRPGINHIYSFYSKYSELHTLSKEKRMEEQQLRENIGIFIVYHDIPSIPFYPISPDIPLPQYNLVNSSNRYGVTITTYDGNGYKKISLLELLHQLYKWYKRIHPLGYLRLQLYDTSCRATCFPVEMPIPPLLRSESVRESLKGKKKKRNSVTKKVIRL